MRRGFEVAIASTLCASVAASTMRQYSVTYRLWSAFCADKQWNKYEVTVHSLISFLNHIFTMSTNSYSTFNTHRAALSLLSDKDVGSHPDVKRFLRSLYKLRPPKPRYSVTWDPTQVLDFFRASSDQSLEFLSRKLLVLLLLASGQRLQTIKAIHRHNIRFSSSHVVIVVPQLLKTSRPGANSPSLSFPVMPQDVTLCVPSTLRRYLDLTNSFADPQGPLFLSTRGAQGPAAGPTLARWVKNVLERSGVDTALFKCHSTRHASVSAAARREVPVDVIFAAAGWSSRSHTFQRFYNRPMASQDTFARAILAREGPSGSDSINHI